MFPALVAPWLRGICVVNYSRIELHGVRHRLVIIVGEIVLGDLIRRRLPNPLMRHDVIKDLVQVLDAVRLADEEWMQGDAHDPPALRPLVVELVELGLANSCEVLHFVVGSE